MVVAGRTGGAPGIGAGTLPLPADPVNWPFCTTAKGAIVHFVPSEMPPGSAIPRRAGERNETGQWAAAQRAGRGSARAPVKPDRGEAAG